MTDRELLKEARDRLHAFAEPFPTNWATPEEIFGLLARIDAELTAPVSTADPNCTECGGSGSVFEGDGSMPGLSRTLPCRCTEPSTGPLEDVHGVVAGDEAPDCWAILTPNGSKLVSPDEAKGMLKAYPLYTRPQSAARPSDDARDAWVSVDDRRPAINHGGDDVPVWTWDGESVKEDFYLEMYEQPLGFGGWQSIGWGFLADGGGRQATHWMPRPTPEPPAMRAQGEGK